MATFIGAKISAPTVPIRRQPLRLPLPALLLWWLVRFVCKVVIVTAKSPVALCALALIVVGVLVARLIGAAAVLAGYVWLTFVFLAVLAKWEPLQRTLRSRWRRFSVYRYKWPATMNFAGLDRTRSNGVQYAPVLKTVRSTKSVDTVRARMLAGQVVEDWGKKSDRLCQTFGAQDCRVTSVAGRPHEVQLSFLINDPLQEVVEPAVGQVDQLAALSVGLQEDGRPYRLPLLGNHILIAGKTGAGKSGAEWAIIHALSSAIESGTVQLLGIDPKADELSFGESLFTELAYRTPSDFAIVLEEAVSVMQRRQLAMRGVSRLHIPTPDQPLIVVFIDELFALSLVADRDTKRRIESALGLLLSQGRAAGVSVVGCVQDPRKESVPARGLYTVRVLLAVNEADDVDLVLDRGARDRGARADKIPANLQGVGFVEVDGVAEPVRVRFAYVTDDHIRALTTVNTRSEPVLRAVEAPPEDQAA